MGAAVFYDPFCDWVTVNLIRRSNILKLTDTFPWRRVAQRLIVGRAGNHVQERVQWTLTTPERPNNDRQLIDEMMMLERREGGLPISFLCLQMLDD